MSPGRVPRRPRRRSCCWFRRWRPWVLRLRNGRGWKAIPRRRFRTTAAASWPASKRPGIGPRRCRSRSSVRRSCLARPDPATYEIFRPIARFGVHVVPSWRTHRVSLIHADDLLQAMILAAQRGKRIFCDPADGVAAAQGCYFAPAERDLTYAEMGRMMGPPWAAAGPAWFGCRPLRVWTFGLVATAFSQLRGQAWYFNLDKAREARAGSWTCSGAAAARELGVCRGRSLGGAVAADGLLVSRARLAVSAQSMALHDSPIRRE